VVAFDVLFAEADRTSIETIVKQLPPEEAKLVFAVTAGHPSNDQFFAAALKDTPSVLPVALGQGPNATLPAKAGFAIGGDDPWPFLLDFSWETGNLPEFDDTAHGIGAFNWVAERDQIVHRITSCSGSMTLSSPLAAVAIHVA
jgi:adenylate cyclase